MSLFSTETIIEYANIVGIKDFPTELAELLASDVEYRLRILIQDGVKFMQHSRRNKLSVEDVNNAFRLRRIEPTYGYDPQDGFNFVEMSLQRDSEEKPIFYIPDQIINLLEYLSAPPEELPVQEALSSHWLAIEGVQPRIAENLFPAAFDDPQKGLSRQPFDKEDVKESAVKTSLLQHNLSKEMQLYFDTVEECLLSEEAAKKEIALEAVRGDAGIQQLVPYFTQLISDVVTKNLRALSVLQSCLGLAEALLQNHQLFLEPYLHQLLPSVLTCVVGKSLCGAPALDDHWGLRHRASNIVAFICCNYGDSYHTLQPRVTKTLITALLDRKKPLTTHYGAIYALGLLGTATIESILLPQLPEYLSWLSTPTLQENLFQQRVFNLIREKCHLLSSEQNQVPNCFSKEAKELLSKALEYFQ